MKPIFLEPFTGFGFWKLFIQEESLTFLLDFLNTLLTLESPIVELRLLQPEDLAPRTVLADTSYHILCIDQEGQFLRQSLERKAVWQVNKRISLVYAAQNRK